MGGFNKTYKDKKVDKGPYDPDKEPIDAFGNERAPSMPEAIFKTLLEGEGLAEDDPKNRLFRGDTVFSTSAILVTHYWNKSPQEVLNLYDAWGHNKFLAFTEDSRIQFLIDNLKITRDDVSTLYDLGIAYAKDNKSASSKGFFFIDYLSAPYAYEADFGFTRYASPRPSMYDCPDMGAADDDDVRTYKAEVAAYDRKYAGPARDANDKVMAIFSSSGPNGGLSSSDVKKTNALMATREIGAIAYENLPSRKGWTGINPADAKRLCELYQFAKPNDKDPEHLGRLVKLNELKSKIAGEVPPSTELKHVKLEQLTEEQKKIENAEATYVIAEHSR